MRILNFLKRFFWDFFKKCKALEFVQIFVFAFTITACLIALNYFVKRASLSIQMLGSLCEITVHSKTVREYYAENGFLLPVALIPIVKYDLSPEMAKKQGSLFNSHESLIEFMRIKKNERMEKFGLSDLGGDVLKERTRDLENRLKITEPDKQHGWAWVRSDFYFLKDLPVLAEECKKALSDEEYYIFLCALIRSRDVEQHVVVKNNGDVDLQDINITIHAPYSEIAGNRKNNIKGVNAEAYQPPFFCKMGHDYVELRIPKLVRNKEINFVIHTVENKLNENEISSTYAPVREINYSGVFKIFILSLLGMFGVYLTPKFIAANYRYLFYGD